MLRIGLHGHLPEREWQLSNYRRVVISGMLTCINGMLVVRPATRIMARHFQPRQHRERFKYDVNYQACSE